MAQSLEVSGVLCAAETDSLDVLISPAEYLIFTPPPPQWGGLDLDSRNSGCARLGGEVGPPLGVVVEEVAVLVVLVRRHRHAVRTAVRRAVDDEVPGAIKKEM